jgi:hypothetical protein
MGWLDKLLGKMKKKPVSPPAVSKSIPFRSIGGSLPNVPNISSPPKFSMYGTTTGRYQTSKPNLVRTPKAYRAMHLSPGVYTQEIDLKKLAPNYTSGLNDCTIYVRAILDVHSDSADTPFAPRRVTVVMDEMAYAAMPKYFDMGLGYANLHLLIKGCPEEGRTLQHAQVVSAGNLQAKRKRPDLHKDSIRVTFSCSRIRSLMSNSVTKPLGRFNRMWV